MTPAAWPLAFAILTLIACPAAGAAAISCKDVPGGAELACRTADAALAAAIHSGFDAQVADHGPDAAPGHGHHQGAAHGR
jgi:hypothetical protein